MNDPVEKILSNPDVYLVDLPEETKEVYFDVLFNFGSRGENDLEHGVGHALEHYLAGTLYDAFNYRLSPGGFIGYQDTYYYIETDKKHLTKDVGIMLDGLFNPNFNNEKLFLFERQSIINELRESCSNLERRVYQEELEKRFSKKCRYSRTTQQEILSTMPIKLEDCRKHHAKNYYNPADVKIFLAVHKPTSKQIAEFVEKIKSIKWHKNPVEEKVIKQEYSDFLYTERPENRFEGQAHVLTSFPANPLTVPIADRLNENWMARLFTGSNKSGIFGNVRRAGIYKVEYSTLMYDDFGLIEFYSVCFPDQVKTFLKLLAKQISSFKSKIITKQEVSKLIERTEFELIKTPTDNRMLYNYVFDSVKANNRFVATGDFINMARNITVDSIKHTAGHIFNPEKINITVAGEVKNLNSEDVKKLFV